MGAEIVEGGVLRADGSFAPARLEVRDGVVVSLGHSDATPEEADAVPARMITHLFNAMRPPHHRRPTLATWALLHDSVAVGLIPDGLHVDPLVLRLVRRLAGDRVIVVS